MVNSQRNQISRHCLNRLKTAVIILEKIMTTLSVHEGNWGDWGSEVSVPDGYFLKGMRVRFESSQGGGDDTGLNGIEMICQKFSDSSLIRVMVHEGFWGDWGNDVLVPNDCYVIGMSVRYELPIGTGDDTALNGINLIHRNFGSGQVGKIEVHGGIWGTWLGDVSVAGTEYVGGLQVRVEAPQGTGDDTAMNGIRLLVKSLPPTTNEVGS
jgi:Vitelline membrane outer layer protein I (VOMI)